MWELLEEIKMDKYTKLLNAAKNVRRLQKRYFATRSHTVLQESKQAERDLDKLLVELEKPEDETLPLFAQQERKW